MPHYKAKDCEAKTNDLREPGYARFQRARVDSNPLEDPKRDWSWAPTVAIDNHREMKLTAERTIIVPGNHDLSWDEEVYETTPHEYQFLLSNRAESTIGVN
jgi:hypothetical protein